MSDTPTAHTAPEEPTFVNRSEGAADGTDQMAEAAQATKDRISAAAQEAPDAGLPSRSESSEPSYTGTNGGDRASGAYPHH